MNADQYRLQGDTKLKARDLDGAIADYSEALRLDPTLGRAYVNRGMARKTKNDIDGAIADYTEAIRLNPKDAVAYNNRGYTRYETGDYDGAIADCDEAIRLNSGQSYFYHSRGMARAAKGNFNGATADFMESLRLKPDHPKAQFMRDKIAEWGQSGPSSAILDHDDDDPFKYNPIQKATASPFPSPSPKPVAVPQPKPQATPQVRSQSDDHPSLAMGCVGGFIGMIAGAAVWALFTAITGIQFGLVAVAIGFLTGFGVRFFGRGDEMIFGVVGAVLSFCGFFLGKALTIVVIAARNNLLDRVSNPVNILIVMGRTFNVIDLLFLGIALYEGFRFSFVSGRQQARQVLRKR